jgi:hypothetical protein
MSEELGIFTCARATSPYKLVHGDLTELGR